MAKLNKAPYLFLLFLFVVSFKGFSVHGFFIDLETLGFSSSKDDGDRATSVLIAAPSEMETVEVESKSDPNKSVRLTLEELKSLIMGSVKDIAANAKPQPININISTKGRNREKEVANAPNHYETTTQASSYSNTKYKYQQITERYPVEAPVMDDDSWAYTPSLSVYETNSNEVASPSAKEEAGLISTAKAIFRSPAHIMNSYSKTFGRWRSSPKSKPKPKWKPGRRPLPDIVVHHDNRRNRRRKKPQQRRRPQRYNPPRRKRPQRVYYEDEYGDHSEYYDTRSRSSYGDEEAWDRSGANFDSTLPGDDIPMNMSPPRPYVL